MTTTQPTQNDQETVDAMVTAQQAEQITAELQAAIDALDTNLAALHTESDADQRLAIAQNTREWIIYIGSLAENGVALTGSAIDIAKKALEQRDKALDELNELTEAIDLIDEDHPKIAVLVETIEESVTEYMYDQAYDSVYEEISEDLIEGIARNLDVSYVEADMFIDAMRGIYHVWGDRPTQSVAIERLIARLHVLKARLEASES